MKTRALCVHDADEALRYYAQAFGVTALSRSSSAGRSVIRAELAVDGSTLVLSEAGTEDGRRPTNPGMDLHVVVAAEVAPIWDAALAAGAEAWTELEFAADAASGILRDPLGHVWEIASAPRLTAAELDAAAAKFRACWEPDLPAAQAVEDTDESE